MTTTYIQWWGEVDGAYEVRTAYWTLWHVIDVERWTTRCGRVPPSHNNATTTQDPRDARKPERVCGSCVRA